MALVQIMPPPGIVNNGTEYAEPGRWRNANLIRWVEGYIKPIGGWEAIIVSGLSGVPISMFAYKYNSGTKVLAIGTSDGVYIYDGSLTEITPEGFVAPSANNNSGFGFGVGLFGMETYGTKRTSSGLGSRLYHYHFDAWGENLVFCCSSDGKIYVYEPSELVAVQIPNSPEQCTAIRVTSERFLVAFGAGGEYNRIEWCDRENYEVWTPASTNLAGGLNITGNSDIYATSEFAGDILIHTKSDIHLMRYVGAPFVYGVTHMQDCPAPYSPASIVKTPQGLAWAGTGGVMMYNGTLQPVKCDVWGWFTDALNNKKKESIHGGHNTANAEVWWFFPADNEDYPDRYITWRYNDDLWATGYIGRTAWIDSGVWPYPIGASADGKVYQHELPSLHMSDGIDDYVPFVESGPFEIGSGDKLMVVRRLIPDEQPVSERLYYTLTGKSYPGTYSTTAGPYMMNNGKIDLRVSGRQFAIKIDCPTTEKFTIGKMRADVVAGGER